MRTILYIVSAMVVIGLAFWAYTENYRTQAAIKQTRALHSQIGAAHERLAVLRAEWAYLNRPDRLLDLAELNFDRLGLLPIMPEAFGRIEQIAYPPLPLPAITEPIELSSDNAGMEPL
ncbi:MAG: hypothetical protein HLUCCA08_07075 [Rhodobacteraceae bacterium HLUCCA08]|nr:MAG: hypothetical protein HLUCCA08_07075 [Rhodobacteraceae bacterium HLUCCA08]